MKAPEPFTLIIPAHNEEAVIERCIRTALAGAPSTEAIELIIAANGCDDETVAIAKKVAPDALVLDLPTGSKTCALNAANARARSYPRIYLDADVECEFSSLNALADALRDPGTLVVAPSIRLNLDHCNWLVRAYYAAWMKQPYANAGKGGAGCYGLSKTALQEIGQFPPIIGDDIWIHTRFGDDVKEMLEFDGNGEPVFSVVRPPSTALGQVRVEARRIRGNQQVRELHPSPHLEAASSGGGLLGSLKSGAAPLDLLVFLCVKLMVRAKIWFESLRGIDRGWTRDLSSRQG